MPYPMRARFKKEILAEFLPPTAAGKQKNAKVVIVCDGAPGMPSKGTLLDFFSRKGYWAINFRYRGSWESDGVFLRRSPTEDVLDIIDQLPRGFNDILTKKTYRIRPSEIIIVANSFGGPAGILASLDPRVTNVICVSPVVDWLAPGKEEPLDWLEGFVHEAFGNGYRFGPREWKKLSSGTFYNPVYHIPEIDGSKLFIFHAKDDNVVGAREVVQFAHATGAKLKLFPRGDHLSSTTTVIKHWKLIAPFLKRKGSEK